MSLKMFIIFGSSTPGWGAESAISSLVPKSFGTLSSAPDSSGDISALRRSWKVFLGSKFASASSTIRKTKQLMVLATSEKVIPKCQKNCHSAKLPLASLWQSSLAKLGISMVFDDLDFAFCPPGWTKSFNSSRCWRRFKPTYSNRGGLYPRLI